MPAFGETDGRAWLDGCAGPRAHACRLSGAGQGLLPATDPPFLTKRAAPIGLCRPLRGR